MTNRSGDKILLDDKITLAVGESYIIKPTFNPYFYEKVVGTIIHMESFQGHLYIEFVTDRKHDGVPIKATITVGIDDKNAFSLSDSGTIEYIHPKKKSQSSKSPKSPSGKSKKGGRSVRRRKTLKVKNKY
jgi:hypothetical protein